MGLALSQIANDLVRLPSGQSLREAELKVMETGRVHNFLEKGWSEPSWVGQLWNDTGLDLPKVKTTLLGCPGLFPVPGRGFAPGRDPTQKQSSRPAVAHEGFSRRKLRTTPSKVSRSLPK